MKKALDVFFSDIFDPNTFIPTAPKKIRSFGKCCQKNNLSQVLMGTLNWQLLGWQCNIYTLLTEQQ